MASVSTRWNDRTPLPGELKVWEISTGKEIFSVSVAGESVAYHPDGTRLAVACWGDRIRTYDAHTGQELLSIPGGAEYTVTYSPDGKWLAGPASGPDPDNATVLRIWDAESGDVLRTLVGHSGHQINDVAFNHDGRILASAGGDRTVKLWDTRTGEELASLKGHTNIVRTVAFNSAGTRLATSSLDGTARVWDVAGVRKGRLFRTPRADISCMAFSPDGNRLVTGGGNGDRANDANVGVLKLWDILTGREIISYTGHTKQVRNVAFSPDGYRLASQSNDKTIKVWDAQSGKELFSLVHEAPLNRSTNLVFSPDGKHLAAASGPELVKVWDAETGREFLSLQKKQINPDLRGHGPGIGLAYSPDGKRLVGTFRGGMITWDTQTGAELASLEGTAAPISPALAFSPDGKTFASSKNEGPGGFGEIIVRDSQTGQELLTLRGHSAVVSSIAYSPDGKRIFSASGNPTGGNQWSGEVKIWDAESGLELLTIPGGSYSHRVAISPDGQRLADCVYGTLKIYDATPLPEKP